MGVTGMKDTTTPRPRIIVGVTCEYVSSVMAIVE
jgi:hypothetical protein